MAPPCELPLGPVTLMFCDMEGSTLLARRMGDCWLGVLADQRRLLREAVARHGGVELGIEGDGLHAAFSRGPDAIAAAADAQRALAAHDWPEGATVRVRMGLHTGEPALTGDGYEGLDMHRAARVMAAGHGGQVLLTDAVRETLGGQLPAQMAVRDIGLHALRDMPGPERLFQLDVAGLPSAFPPLRAAGGVVATGLPALATELLGRDGDLDVLADLVLDPTVRLVTVTGEGGVGKTSAAVAVAARVVGRFTDAAAFVDLSAVRHSGSVAESLLAALGGVAETGSTTIETLRRMLAPREQLLVIDNFEQVIDAAPLLADLLVGAPGVTMLVTSRFALDLRAERRYPLSGLRRPADGTVAAVTQAPATAVFIACSRARDPAFAVDDESAAAIADICARVGGLPLGIELAAARTRTLSVQEIAGQLERVMASSFGVGRDLPERHRTLTATLDWTCSLLPEAELDAYARFAVFAGGCTIQAAREVIGAADDVIDGLLAKSVLTRRGAGEGARLGMQEVVREHAAALLRSRSDRDRVGERHSRYFLEYARAAAPRLRGREQREWYVRLRAESKNLLHAMRRDRDAGRPERVLRLAVALDLWWNDTGRDGEGVATIVAALDAVGDDLPAHLRAHAQVTLGFLAVRNTDFAFGLERYREATELFAALGDEDGAALSQLGASNIRWLQGERGPAEEAARDAVRRAQEGSRTQGLALVSLAVAVADADEARRVADRAQSVLDRIGDLRAQSLLWGNLGFSALERGDLEAARELTQRSLELSEHADDYVNATYDIATAGMVALESGDLDGAIAHVHEVLLRSRSYGLSRPVPDALIALAAIASRDGEHDLALRLLDAGCAVQRDEPLGEAQLRLRAEVLAGASRESAGAPAPALEDAIRLGLQTVEHLLQGGSANAPA